MTATAISRFGTTCSPSLTTTATATTPSCKQKNIDTGMGLERLACVCQNVNSLFDVDTVMNITNKVSELTGAHYGESHQTDVSLRVITDHIRSCRHDDLRRRSALQRGPRLCAAPPAAPGCPPRKASGRQPSRSSTRWCDTVIHENECALPGPAWKSRAYITKVCPDGGGELRQDH